VLDSLLWPSWIPPSSRQTVSRPQPIDLRAFLVETLTMLDRLIPETVRFEIDAAPGQSTPPHGNRESILVVEDDPTVRELTGELLDALGYQPICTGNGIEALDAIDTAEHRIHLVLSDVAMPDIGGIELAVELEQREPSIPVVLMSGYVPDPMGGGFSSNNLAAWLQKPFSVDALASTLAEVLSMNS